VAVSPDGKFVAVGDHKGQLRVFDMSTLSLMLVLDSHDGEVLAVDYSPLITPGGGYLLASGGCDGTVHVYDARKDYDIVRTMTDHDEGVTVVRFAAGGKVLVSCSTNNRVMFR
jgi:WD40 repeat protein